MNFFSLYFDIHILENVDFTNASASKRRAEQQHKAKWTDTNTDELKAFIGKGIITNDMVVSPRTERYFTCSEQLWYLQVPGIGRILTRNRFQQLERYIHFEDPYS